MKTQTKERTRRPGWLATVGLTLSLLVATPVIAQDERLAHLDVMSSYLALIDQAVDMAGRPESASMLAIEGIFEVYEQRRDAKGAIEHFQGLLVKHQSNRAVRTIIRMKLRDIYKEIGELDKALEQLDLVIAENLAE